MVNTEPLHQRQSFGPPMPVSDELQSMKDMTLEEFMHRPVAKHDHFRNCIRVAFDNFRFPKTEDVERYLASDKHGFSPSEIESFTNSQSYTILCQSQGPASEVDKYISAEAYVDNALLYAEWHQVVGWGKDKAISWVNPSKRYQDELSMGELTANGLELALTPQPWEHFAAVPLSVIIFAARRGQMFWYLRTIALECSDDYPDALYPPVETDTLHASYAPYAGDAWLAWMMLVQKHFHYTGADPNLPSKFGVNFRRFIADVIPRHDEFGGFDAALPYFKAGVSIDAIGPSVRDGVPPDIAAQIAAS